MEGLKSLGKLLERDDRLSYFGVTLEYLPHRAAAVVLSSRAPEKVHN